MLITFYLVPDKYSAHFIRRELTKKSSLLGIQIGTWPELLELAANSFCLPLSKDEWQTKLDAEIPKVRNAFWLESLTFDAEATTTIISGALIDLLAAMGPDKPIDLCKYNLSQRGQRQIKDLLTLHKKMGGALPLDLTLAENLLAAPLKQAIRTIRVLCATRVQDLNAWQTALIKRLNNDAEQAAVRPLTQAKAAAGTDNDFVKKMSWLPPAKGKGGVSHLQRSLFVNDYSTPKSRLGLTWLAVRDYRHEVELAAGMVQKLMADSTIASNEIAVLLPESADYTNTLAEVFQKAGIPVSGLTRISGSRDHGRELLYFFLLCRKSISPPPMLLASLFGSPLLPWSLSAPQIAQSIMDGAWISSIVEDLPDDQRQTALFLSGKQITAAKRLVKSLRGLTAVIAKGEDFAQQRQAAMAIIQELLPPLAEKEEIDWNTLLRIAQPQAIISNEQADINLEGVCVFHPEQEPWQEVKHLLVLGFKDGLYPQTPSIFPVIPEEDRLILEKEIRIPSHRAIIKQQRRRFSRQLCAASKSITFFIPRLSGSGERLQPSASLGFMAKLFDGAASGEDLIVDPEHTKNINNLILATAAKQFAVPPGNIRSADLNLKENLLTKRKNSEGKTAPESPSGLEKMMVSPLAWLLTRYDISSHEWGPAGLDALVIGSIAHEIFERLFCHNTRLPQKSRVGSKVQSLFNQVVKDDFKFLLQDEWQVECRQMVKQFTEAAVGWLEFLNKNNLEILGEETWLTGRFYQHPIRGKADLICRARDGRLFVVDYKTSKSGKRKERMEKGNDHQAALYCQMLESGTPPDDIPVKLKNHLKKSPRIGALYYTLRDQVILGDKEAGSLKDAEKIQADIAKNSLRLIKERMKELRDGKIIMNKDTDPDYFEKDLSIAPYALNDSPLIRLFMKEV